MPPTPCCATSGSTPPTSQMFLHVDTSEGRARPARPEILARVAKLAAAHTALPRPERAGRAIGIPAPR
jgi:acyl-CoA thioester hydrolase